MRAFSHTIYLRGTAVNAPLEFRVIFAGGLNRSTQHQQSNRLKVVCMLKEGRPGLSEEQKVEMWRQWRRGASVNNIAAALGRTRTSIQASLIQLGGIAPAIRIRAARALTMAEREEISRGLCAGEALRVLLRSFQSLAARKQREYQWLTEAVFPEEDRSVRLHASTAGSSRPAAEPATT